METNTPKEALSWEEALDKAAQKFGFADWEETYSARIQDYSISDIYKEASLLFRSSAIEKLEEKHKIELSNYAYQMDMAKRERDKAEEENKRLQARLEAADELSKSCKLFLKNEDSKIDKERLKQAFDRYEFLKPLGV